MRRPMAADFLRPGRAAALLVPGMVAVAPLAAQRPPPSTPRWTWYLSGSVGLVSREIATWKPTHTALAATGWDGHFQTSCIGLCANAADNVEGRPAAVSAALRRHLDGSWQLRLMGATASPGYYPGGYQTIPLTVEPKTTTVSGQLLLVVKSFWFAAGPSWYEGRVDVVAGSSSATARKSGAGLVLSGAANFPRTTNWFIEALIERRFAGTATTPLITVSGAPDVPSLEVPLSATVLSVGVGWRL